MTKTFKHIMIRTREKTFSYVQCSLLTALQRVHSQISDEEITKIICK